MDNGSLHGRHQRCCSFCGHELFGNTAFVSRTGAGICSSCVLRLADLDCQGRSSAALGWTLQTPQSLKAAMDDYVIGQDDAKRCLAVAVYNHYKRITHRTFRRDLRPAKSNILIVGPSGCGKTLLARTLAGLVEVPFVMANATSFTGAGCADQNVEEIFVRLLDVAGGDIEWAQQGIVFVDEIDKIALKQPIRDNARDPSGESVQRALLGVMEGRRVAVSTDWWNRGPKRSSDMDDSLYFDTSEVLFLCAGRFGILDEIATNRGDERSVGLNVKHASTGRRKTTSDEWDPEPPDLASFGLIPELVGRLPIVTALHGLDESSLIRVLTEPRGALVEQYRALFKLSNVRVDFEPLSLRLIARSALARGAGARGLRVIMEQILLDPMFEVADRPQPRKVTVTADMVRRAAAQPQRGDVATNCGAAFQGPQRKSTPIDALAVTQVVAPLQPALPARSGGGNANP